MKKKPKILIGFYDDINGKNAVPLDYQRLFNLKGKV